MTALALAATCEPSSGRVGAQKGNRLPLLALRGATTDIFRKALIRMGGFPLSCRKAALSEELEVGLHGYIIHASAPKRQRSCLILHGTIPTKALKMPRGDPS